MANLQNELLKAEGQLTPNKLQKNDATFGWRAAEAFVNLQFIQEIFWLPTDFKLELLVLTDEE